MSRSWIDRLARRAQPVTRAGLVFARDAIGYVLLRPDGRGLSVQQWREAVPAHRPDPADRASLPAVVQTVRELAAGIAGRYQPLHVSLADSAARLSVLELESVPADRAGQRQLAAFRLERDGGQKPVRLACQALGNDDGKSLLLTASLDRDWVAYLDEALSLAGLVPASIGIDLFRQFNRFHDRLLAGGQGGALLVLAAHHWSALIWDREGRARLVRSRPRQPGANDFDAVAGELERLILAWVHGGAGRAVGNIYVLADDPAMADILDRRLRTPCVRIDPYEGCRWEDGPAPSPGGIAPMALAAALAGM